MSRCRRCKREGNWSIECTDCLVEEIKNTASELQQLEAIKRELETMMAAELAREQSQESLATCIRCGEPRNIQNIPWCEKCLKDDGLKIKPEQIPEPGKTRRWCPTHLRLENGPPWECFKPSFLEMHPSVETAMISMKHFTKYQLPDGPATEEEEQDLESEIRKRYPR